VPDQPQPRRRITDSERRRWSDKALDMLGRRVESHAEDIEELRAEMRAVSRLPGEMASLTRAFERFRENTITDLMQLREDSKEDFAEVRKDIRELRADNRQQHKRVAYGVDPEDGKTPLPAQPATLTWGGVLKVATAVSLVLGPIAIIVAALLQGGS
jgi:hypothetical protein